MDPKESFVSGIHPCVLAGGRTTMEKVRRHLNNLLQPAFTSPLSQGEQFTVSFPTVPPLGSKFKFKVRRL